VAQQKLAQLMAMAQLIPFGRLARPHQIAQDLLPFIRNPHRGQLSRAVAARQSLRVAAVRLDSISRLGRDQARRDDLALHSQLRKVPYSTYPVEPASGTSSM
jgi:hypothetical protein